MMPYDYCKKGNLVRVGCPLWFGDIDIAHDRLFKVIDTSKHCVTLEDTITKTKIITSAENIVSIFNRSFNTDKYLSTNKKPLTLWDVCLIRKFRGWLCSIWDQFKAPARSIRIWLFCLIFMANSSYLCVDSGINMDQSRQFDRVKMLLHCHITTIMLNRIYPEAQNSLYVALFNTINPK